MAEEIKKIISVDSSSLEEYKRRIDTLRSSMSSLKKDSVEWKSANEELNSTIEKLHSTIGGETSGIETLTNTLTSSSGKVQSWSSVLNSSFKTAGQAAASAVPGVSSLNKAFMSLIANPVGATIAAVAVAITSVVKAIRSSEERMDRFHNATAGLQMVWDKLGKVIGSVADGVVGFIEKMSSAWTSTLKWMQSTAETIGWDKLASSLKTTIDELEDYNEKAEKANALAQSQRQTREQLSQLDAKIAEDRLIVADKLNHSLEERNAAEQRLLENTKLRFQIERDQAKYELEVLEARARQKGVNNMSPQELDALSAARTKYTDTIAKESDYMRSLSRAQQSLYKDNQKLKTSNDEVTLSYEKQNEVIKDNLDLYLKEVENTQKSNATLLEERKKLLDQEAERETYWTTQGVESEYEVANIKYEIEKELILKKIELQKQFLDETLLSAEEQIRVQNEIYANQERLNRLENEHLKTQVKADKQAWNAKITAAQSYMQVTTDIFQSISELSEEGSEEQKAFAIMASTISMLESLVQVNKSVWSSPGLPWQHAIESAVFSAGVLASGIANINKIKATTKDSSGTVSVQGPSFSGVGVSPLLNESQDIQQMQSLNVTQDKDKMDQRVYILESDIAESQSRRKVKVEESRF